MQPPWAAFQDDLQGNVVEHWTPMPSLPRIKPEVGARTQRERSPLVVPRLCIPRFEVEFNLGDVGRSDYDTIRGFGGMPPE